MNYLLMVLVATSIEVIKTESIQSKINSYFNDDVVKTFQKKWNLYSISYENAIAKCLREDFGYQTMNVYINRYQSHLLVSTGYYHTDNQVKLVFKNMILEAVPHLHDIDITFSLANNVLLVDASLSRMILHTSYVLFRNVSDIILGPSDQDSLKSSPFRFQQVRNLGDLAITIEGCSFSGIILTTLSGSTINLGHHELRMKDCQYSIEIYKDGSGTPPVIANYLPKGEAGLNLETLLAQSLLEELIPKLQGAMFSEVNTSAIFSTDLPKIRTKQEALFDDTKSWFDELVRGLNKKSLEKNMGTIELEDFTITWDETFEEMPAVKSVKLTKMTMLGLDTVYSSHTGGPIRISEIEIIEQLRFNTLQVTGQISIEGLKGDNEFAVEITDFAVDVNLDSSLKIKLEVLGWRFLEFSCPNLEFLPAESLVVGYLLNEVPKHIKAHLNSVYNGEKVVLSDSEYIEEQPEDGAYIVDSEMLADEKLNQKVDDEQVKLHQEKAMPDEKQLNTQQLKDHPEISMEEERKENNEQENPGKTISQLNDEQVPENVQVHKETELSPEKDTKPVQIKKVDFVPNEGTGQKQAARMKRPHKNMKRKIVYKPIEVYERKNRRTNENSPIKSIHISDNEIL